MYTLSIWAIIGIAVGFSIIVYTLLLAVFKLFNKRVRFVAIVPDNDHLRIQAVAHFLHVAPTAVVEGKNNEYFLKDAPADFKPVILTEVTAHYVLTQESVPTDQPAVKATAVTEETETTGTAPQVKAATVKPTAATKEEDV